jgi:hypothetical protein
VSAATALFKRLSQGTPAAPVFGLPLGRVVPQDVQTLCEYGMSALIGAVAVKSRDPRARTVGLALAAVGAGLALVVDRRLSPVKAVPIEVHEIGNYGVSLSLMAAPWVLGYRRSSPGSAALHVALGAFLAGISALTDYRAAKGVRWWWTSRRSYRSERL